jgi:hypothetical protein
MSTKTVLLVILVLLLTSSFAVASDPDPVTQQLMVN